MLGRELSVAPSDVAAQRQNYHTLRFAHRLIVIGGCAAERWVQAPEATQGPDGSQAYRAQELLVIAFQARDTQECSC